MKKKFFLRLRLTGTHGHMLKAKKQIIEDLKLVDVVLEILDSRIPKSSQNPDFKNIIKQKKQIVLLNKSDLADNKETEKWKSYFDRNNIPALIIDANLGTGVKNIINKIETVLEEDLQKALNKGIKKKSIRVMIIGIPNVGKSSLINRLTNRKSQQVGNKPGVTKQKQWVRISNDIELLDTPGVLWPKFEDNKTAMHLSYIGAIKDELIPKEDVAYQLLKYLWENYQKNVIERYNLTNEDISIIMNKSENYEEDKIIALMELIASKRGAIISGGRVDYEKVANLLLIDFRTAKLGKITLEKV